MERTFAYIQRTKNFRKGGAQQNAITHFCEREGIKIHKTIKLKMSPKRIKKKRNIDIVLSQLQKGDLLIISELSILARSVGQIAKVVGEIHAKEINFMTIRENIRILNDLDIISKTQVEMFSLFAKMESDVISSRTKEGLRFAKTKRVQLGRKKGVQGKSIFDKEKENIIEKMDLGVPVAKIARDLKYSLTGLNYFIKSRNLTQFKRKGK